MSSELLWNAMERRVAELIERYPGVAGACVQDLNGPHALAVNAGVEFPTASSIKIAVLTQLMLRAERGEIDLDERVVVTPQMQTPGSGVIVQLRDAVELSIYDIAVLMIIVSDNTATNMCIDMAGMGETNNLLRELGLNSMCLRRKMMDDAAVLRGDENMSTPADFAALMQALHEGRPTPGAADQVLTILKMPNNGPLKQALAAGQIFGLNPVELASKPGGVPMANCDVGIVYLPRRPYAVSIMTKYQLANGQPANLFIQDVARTVHETMVALDSTTDQGRGRPAT